MPSNNATSRALAKISSSVNEPSYVPSPLEIFMAAAEIRASWDAKTRSDRLTTKEQIVWSVPSADVPAEGRSVQPSMLASIFAG
jgi:hypothetical protein